MLKHYFKIAFRNLLKQKSLIALLIAFVTVSYQSVRAAMTNPSSSLRRE